MKIGGKPIPKPKNITLVFPRGDEQVVFEVQAVIDFAEFERLCPTPQPKMVRKPGMDAAIPDSKNPEYITRVNEYSMRQQYWMMIQSLMATPDLVWEKVQLEDPKTWHSWRDELTESGLNMAEVVRIQQAIHQVNSLDDAALEEARNNFLAGRSAPVNPLTSQKDEQNSTLSGERAKDSESDHQT